MRGQVSFELIVVMTVVLLISAAIASEVLASSNDTFALAAAKTAALNEIAKKGCVGGYLESTKLAQKNIYLTVVGNCKPDAAAIANYVEEKICHATPNNDAIISCGGDNYLVIVS